MAPVICMIAFIGTAMAVGPEHCDSKSPPLFLSSWRTRYSLLSPTGMNAPCSVVVYIVLALPCVLPSWTRVILHLPAVAATRLPPALLLKPSRSCISILEKPGEMTQSHTHTDSSREGNTTESHTQ